MREHSDTIPKPLVEIGNRPIIWHLMKYYAHYGHKDFILCLGYRGNQIKDFFLTYNECVSNDFVFSEGGKKIDLVNSDISDWKITFVDTGLHCNLGQRLLAVREHLADEDVFLANYSDGLTDLPLDNYLNNCVKKGCIASFLCVRPSQSLHAVSHDSFGNVLSIEPIRNSNFFINGGFFVLRREIFEYMEKGDELVEAPFHRLIAKKQLYAESYRGFWAAMDTYKDKVTFDNLYAQGNPPWEIWNSGKGALG